MQPQPGSRRRLTKPRANRSRANPRGAERRWAMQMSGRRILVLAVALATAVSLYLLVRRTGASAVAAAIRPNWLFLGLGFAIIAGVQPLRAWAWSSTVRSPVGFRA